MLLSMISIRLRSVYIVKKAHDSRRDVHAGNRIITIDVGPPYSSRQLQRRSSVSRPLLTIDRYPTMQQVQRRSSTQHPEGWEEGSTSHCRDDTSRNKGGFQGRLRHGSQGGPLDRQKIKELCPHLIVGGSAGRSMCIGSGRLDFKKEHGTRCLLDNEDCGKIDRRALRWSLALWGYHVELGGWK